MSWRVSPEKNSQIALAAINCSSAAVQCFARRKTVKSVVEGLSSQCISSEKREFWLEKRTEDAAQDLRLTEAGAMSARADLCCRLSLPQGGWFRFCRKISGLHIHFDANAALIDFDRDVADMTIRYCNRDYPALQMQLLPNPNIIITFDSGCIARMRMRYSLRNLNGDQPLHCIPPKLVRLRSVWPEAAFCGKLLYIRDRYVLFRRIVWSLRRRFMVWCCVSKYSLLMPWIMGDREIGYTREIIHQNDNSRIRCTTGQQWHEVLFRRAFWW